MNAAQFLASKIKNRKTNVSIEDVAKMKLEGFPKSLTAQGLSDLAGEQTGDVKVSLPKAEIAPGVTASRSGSLKPTETATLIALGCNEGAVQGVPKEAPKEPSEAPGGETREEIIDGAQAKSEKARKRAERKAAQAASNGKH